uniref:Uncharacterized protein n=1 Tax=Rhizophora mucronata TaxID=61149 RepID=A0A2P2INY7_RHIMU
MDLSYSSMLDMNRFDYVIFLLILLEEKLMHVV